MIDGTTRMTLCWSPISTNRIPVTLSGYIKPSCLVGTETSTSVTIANVNTVKVMPSSLLQSDGGAFIHMIMVGIFTIGSRVL